ncbi:MAG: hypothetical protein ACRDY3_09310 [Acidimicrobiales bacterium]
MGDHGRDRGSATVEVDLDAAAETGRWRTAAMPGSSGPVQLQVLGKSTTGAMSALVRFPLRWSRQTSGSYAASELFVVLEGALQLGDIRFGGGTGAFVPGHTIRQRTEAPCGALAFAHFDAFAAFVAFAGQAASGFPPGNGEPRRRDRWPLGGAVVSFSLADAADARCGTHGARVIATDGRGWTSRVLARTEGAAPGPVEMLSPTARRWVHAEEGAEAPALEGPIVVLRPG